MYQFEIMLHWNLELKVICSGVVKCELRVFNDVLVFRARPFRYKGILFDRGLCSSLPCLMRALLVSLCGNICF